MQLAYATSKLDIYVENNSVKKRTVKVEYLFPLLLVDSFVNAGFNIITKYNR